MRQLKFDLREQMNELRTEMANSSNLQFGSFEKRFSDLQKRQEEKREPEDFKDYTTLPYNEPDTGKAVRKKGKRGK
jgi:hypothetical protein